MSPNKFLKRDSKGMLVLKFGRHKGEYLYDVALEDPEYLAWMASALELPEDVSNLIKGVL